MTDDKDKAVRVRELTLGNVVVGHWVPVSEGSKVEQFVPLENQPPADRATDARKVEAWLKEQKLNGDYSLIRGYHMNIRVGTKTTVTTALVKR